MQLDPNIYEAALDLGAGPTRALFKVMFPLLAPAILSGFVMSFTLSMDDFIITQFNKGTGTNIETLSTYIYSDVRVKGMEPFWFAIFSIIFVVVLSTLLIINLKNNLKRSCTKMKKPPKSFPCCWQFLCLPPLSPCLPPAATAMTKK